MDDPNVSKIKAPSLWRPILILLFAGIVLVAGSRLNLDDWIMEAKTFIDNTGQRGAFAFIGLYILLTVLAIPGTPLTLAAGAIFGSFLGIVYVSIASIIGAALCFLISRYFARDVVSRWLASRKAFQKLNQMTEKHGDIIVAITRLVPIFPYNLLNYGFGLTNISFKTYFFWSWACMLPSTALYVAGAAATMQALTDGKIAWPLVVFMLLTVAILAVLVHNARKKIKQDSLQEDETQK
jgi:uncharacterized membrane protein YdjX (TVP38/TMEM64 family)